MRNLSRASIFLLGAYFLGLHLLLVAVVSKTDILHRIGMRLGIPFIDKSHIDERAYMSAFTVLRKIDSLMVSSPVVLLGDSLVQQSPLLSGSPPVMNLGLGGIDTNTLAGWVRRFPYLDKAGAVVIGVGSNDLCLGRASTSQMRDRIDSLSANIPAGVRVVWSAILPVDPRLPNSPCAAVDSDAIRRANNLIRAACAARSACTYSDGFSILADGTGYLLPQYNAGDGVHLSAMGYETWTAQLKRDLALSGVVTR